MFRLSSHLTAVIIRTAMKTTADAAASERSPTRTGYGNGHHLDAIHPMPPRTIAHRHTPSANTIQKRRPADGVDLLSSVFVEAGFSTAGHSVASEATAQA